MATITPEQRDNFIQAVATDIENKTEKGSITRFNYSTKLRLLIGYIFGVGAVADAAQPSEPGKGLSSNNYTDAEKLKLGLISGSNTGDQDLSGLATVTALNSERDARIAQDISLNSRVTTAQSTAEIALEEIEDHEDNTNNPHNSTLEQVLAAGATGSITATIGNGSNTLGWMLANGSGLVGNISQSFLYLKSSGSNNYIDQVAGGRIKRRVDGNDVNIFFEDGRLSGANATNDNEFVTKGQIPVKRSGVFITTDTSQARITIPHGLGLVPTDYDVFPNNANAGNLNISWKDADDTNVYATLGYSAGDSAELKYKWRVEK